MRKASECVVWVQIGDEVRDSWPNKGQSWEGASPPGDSVVKNLPANAGDVGSIPGSGTSLEKETATHSSILSWEIPWTEEPGGL